MDTLPKSPTNPTEIVGKSCLNPANIPAYSRSSSKPRRNFLSKRRRYLRTTAKDKGLVHGKTRKQWQRLSKSVEKSNARFDALAIMTEGVKKLQEVDEKRRLIEANKATLEFCANVELVACIEHEWAPFKCEHKQLTSMCCRYTKQCIKCKKFSIL